MDIRIVHSLRSVDQIVPSLALRFHATCMELSYLATYGEEEITATPSRTSELRCFGGILAPRYCSKNTS